MTKAERDKASPERLKLYHEKRQLRKAAKKHPRDLVESYDAENQRARRAYIKSEGKHGLHRSYDKNDPENAPILVKETQ